MSHDTVLLMAALTGDHCDTTIRPREVQAPQALTVEPTPSRWRQLGHFFALLLGFRLG